MRNSIALRSTKVTLARSSASRWALWRFGDSAFLTSGMYSLVKRPQRFTLRVPTFSLIACDFQHMLLTPCAELSVRVMSMSCAAITFLHLREGGRADLLGTTKASIFNSKRNPHESDSGAFVTPALSSNHCLKELAPRPPLIFPHIDVIAFLAIPSGRSALSCGFIARPWLSQSTTTRSPTSQSCLLKSRQREYSARRSFSLLHEPTTHKRSKAIIRTLSIGGTQSEI